MKLPTQLLVQLAFLSSAWASQEGILPLSSFRLESAGIGTSGKIIIKGNQNEKADQAIR